jgi:hypothetical protein
MGTDIGGGFSVDGAVGGSEEGSEAGVVKARKVG